MTLQNKSLERRVQVQESMHKEGIRYADLTVDRLVQRLWEVDQIEMDEMASRRVTGA